MNTKSAPMPLLFRPVRRAKWLGLPSEMRLNGRGVSACAVCDGFFFRNQDVAIVGAGDTAAEEASYLANLCRKVYMLVRRHEMRASRFMQQRVKSLPNVRDSVRHRNGRSAG